MALTGATGFIGSAVARLLVGRGYEVRALIREGSRSRGFDLPGLTWVPGNLSDAVSLDRLVAGAGVIIHCAGVVRGATAADFDSVNIGGVERMVRAAQKVPHRPRFLLFSSLAARAPELSFYASSKKGGEDVLASLADEMEWIALRPPAVYGPGDRELLPLFQWMRRGIVPILGNPQGRFSLIYVDDLAAAVDACLGVSDPWPGVPFELHDGRKGGYGWDDIRGIMSQIYKKDMHRLIIPKGLLQWAGAVNSRANRLIGKQPMLTPGKVRELCHDDWVCDNLEFCTFSGWTPSVPFAAGVKKTLDN